MKFFSLYVLILMLGYIQPVKSQILKYSNNFLETGGFSRSKSLSGSDFSSIEGAEAGFYNPSRMFAIGTGVNLSMMHNNYFGSMAKVDMFAAVFRTDENTNFGVSLLRFGVDDVQNTIGIFDADGNIDYSKISYFSTADYALYFSLSRRLKNHNFSVGSNLKLIYRMEGSFAKAYGFGFDVAFNYKKNNKFSVSAIINDVTTTFDFWSVNKSKFDSTYLSTGNSVPENSLEQTAPTLTLGASYLWTFFYNFRIHANFALKSFFENRNLLVHSNFISLDPKFGLEFSYINMFFLRVGVSDFQFDKNLTISKKFSVSPSFGAGIEIPRFRFDYAFYSNNAISLNSNVFTIELKLGKAFCNTAECIKKEDTH